MKKSLATLALIGSITLAGALPAVAADKYPAPGPCNNGNHGDGNQGNGKGNQSNKGNQGNSKKVCVDDGDIKTGEGFHFSGEGFTPGKTVKIEVSQSRGSQASGATVSGAGASLAVAAKIDPVLAVQTSGTTANTDGNFSVPLTINAEGTYQLTATDEASGEVASLTVEVTPAALAATSANLSNTGLASTGASDELLLWSLVGGGALAAGLTSVIVVRRRSKALAAV